MKVIQRDYEEAINYVSTYNLSLAFPAQEVLDGILQRMKDNPEIDSCSTGGFFVARGDADLVDIYVSPSFSSDYDDYEEVEWVNESLSRS